MTDDAYHPTASPRRIAVIGTTGSGKSTCARAIARLTGGQYVELDALHWGPEWTPANEADLRSRTEAALSATDAWVTDGNYYGILGDMIWRRAEMIVWLDYPIRIIFWRLFWRTLRRCVTREELWSGNRERLRTAFLSGDSLFVWALKTHWSKRRSYPEAMRAPENAHLRVVRLRRPAEMRGFLRALAALAPQTRSADASFTIVRE
jgi:adenylate kinase family enzyme